MSDRECLRWLKEARRLLADACGPELGPVRVVIAYKVSGNGVEFTLAEDDGRATRFEPTVPESAGPLERAILGVATREPLTAKKLAGKLQRSCNSHFRDQLRNLVRRGLILHTPDGYRLPA